MNLQKNCTTQNVIYLFSLASFICLLSFFPAAVNAVTHESPDNAVQSASLLTQADIPEDINPNANVSTTTVPSSEVSTSSNETRSSTSSGDSQATTSTDNSENQTGDSNENIWTLLIGLLAAGSLLYAVSGR